MQWVVRISVVILAGLLLARLGPFGTFVDLAWPQRYAYWIGLTALMWSQSFLVLTLLNGHAERFGRIARIVAAAVAGSIPTAFEVAWAEMLLRVERDLGPGDVLAIFGDVLLLAIPLLLITELVGKRPVQADNGIAAPGLVAGDSWLMSKLRPDRRGDLWALEADDHFVRVRTSLGSELLHMRFGDAVSRLGPERGCQVHRRWWVSANAVAASRRDGDRVLIELPDGTEVPVSRSRLLSARQAGLLG